MSFPRAFQTYVPRSHCVSSHVYGAILLNEEKETVIIKGKKSGKWSFPKGHGNFKETPLEASIRELKEETGVNMTGVKPDDEVRFNSGTYFVFFLQERAELIPEDTEEVEEAIWIYTSRIQSLNTNKDLKSFCKHVNIDNILNKILDKKNTRDLYTFNRVLL
jgi:ADP-ribose pyrophosphatase YjhB (NUDIX family)